MSDRRDNAASAYLDASMAFEAAVMSGDAAARRAAEARLAAAGEAYGAAGREMVRAERPGRLFEQVLGDWRMQADPAGQILSSVVEFASAAVPASAGAPAKVAASSIARVVGVRRSGFFGLAATATATSNTAA